MKTNINLDTNYIAGNSVVTRRELEEMPAPICTAFCSNADFQNFVNLTHSTTLSILGIDDNGLIDFDDEHHSSVWWATLEEVATQVFDMPYYEDMSDVEYMQIKRLY